jgi:hypothetical protein
MRKKLTNAKIVRQALKANRGLIALSADDLGCVYQTLKKFIDNDPISQEIIRHAREKRRDRAERRLDDMIDNGEAWAIAMTLKGDPARGYSDKLDVTSGGEKIIVRLVTDDGS